MRFPLPRRTTLLAVTFLAADLLEAPVSADQARSFARLRPLDALAGDLLSEALDRSPTVRSLVRTLEESDLVVQIQVRGLDTFRGHLQFMSGSPDCRWVRVTVSLPSPKPDLLATLGHELQHAVEIAREPDVRDVESVAALFRRIGFRRDGPQFETRAALEIEERVKHELAGQGIFD